MACKSVERRLFVVSLGCPKNRVDSEVMMGRLLGAGWTPVGDLDAADVVVINTCAFIRPATQESIDAILEYSQWKAQVPGRRLVVTGCLPQRYGQELVAELPEVDLFLGTGDQSKLAGLLENPAERVSIGPPEYLYDEKVTRAGQWAPHSAYLKISEGCDRQCTFCTIPGIRGRQRSRTIPSLVSEASDLVNAGVRELCLVAQDTTAFGRDLANGTDLARLVRSLAVIPDLSWLRLLYAYPSHVGDDLLEAMAEEPRVCRYLDIPLQHASDRILRSMGRGLCADDQLRVIDKLRKRIPGIALRSTFIVGFPGETDDDFQILMDFVQEQAFDRVGVFRYYREEGTVAARMKGQLPERVKSARRTALLNAQAVISRARHARLIGLSIPVMVDGLSEESEFLLDGRMESQAPEIDGRVVIASAPAGIRPGSVHPVIVEQVSEVDLVARWADSVG